MGRDISVGIATAYGLDGPGIESLGGEIFRTHLDRPWGPPSFLHNGYRLSFAGVKRPGRDVDHPPTSSAEGKERVQLYIYSPSAPSWPVLGWTLRLPLPLQSVQYKTQPKYQTPVNTGTRTGVRRCPSVIVDTHNICWAFQHKFAVLLQFCCLPVARKSRNR